LNLCFTKQRQAARQVRDYLQGKGGEGV